MKELLKRKAIVEGQIFEILTGFANDFEELDVDGVEVKRDFSEWEKIIEKIPNPNYLKIKSVSLNLSVK